MKEPIKLLDVVVRIDDIPDKSLVGGQVGTVVEELAPGVFEVEFSDNRTGLSLPSSPAGMNSKKMPLFVFSKSPSSSRESWKAKKPSEAGYVSIVSTGFPILSKSRCL